MHRLTSTLLERTPGKCSRTSSIQLSPLRQMDSNLLESQLHLLNPRNHQIQAFPVLLALGRRLEVEGEHRKLLILLVRIITNLSAPFKWEYGHQVHLAAAPIGWEPRIILSSCFLEKVDSVKLLVIFQT